MENEERKNEIQAGYISAKQAIITDYNAKLMAANEKKFRAERIFEAARLQHQQRVIDVKNSFDKDMTALKQEQLKEENQCCGDSLEIQRVRVDYSIAVGNVKAIRNRTLDQADQDYAAAKSTYEYTRAEWMKTLRDISVERDGALNREKELMQDALEALAKETEGHNNSDND